MNCNEFDRLLERDHLEPPECALLKDHAETCCQCLKKLEFEEALRGFSAAASQEELVFDESFTRDIMTSIRKDKTRMEPPRPSSVLKIPSLRKFSFAAAALFLVTVCWFIMSAGPETTEPSIPISNVSKTAVSESVPAPIKQGIKLINQSGQVIVLKSGLKYWKKAEYPVDSLQSGDSIITKAGSRAEIRMISGSIITMHENTIVQVKNNSISLGNGKTFCQINPSGKSFKVTTPCAIAGVMGTVFTVTHSDRNGTYVHVREGKVRFSSTSDSCVLSASEYAKVRQPHGKVIKNYSIKKQPIPKERPVIQTPEVSSPQGTDSGPELQPDAALSDTVPLGETVQESVLIGDIDGNNLIDEEDAGLLSRHLKSGLVLTKTQTSRADTDRNHVIDNLDHFKLRIFCEKSYDLDADGRIDESDLKMLESGKCFDINNDGKIDRTDFMTMKSVFLQVIPNHIGEKL